MDCCKEKANMHLEIVRLNKENIELKKENEEMKTLIETQFQENQTLGNNNIKLLNMFGEAKAQIEKMKRCNNCEYEDYAKYHGEKCNFENYRTCENWELKK